jgi:ABC-type glycerol-3-phosphate transport system substrate-binding protein
MKHSRVKAIGMVVLALAALCTMFVLTAGKEKEEAMKGPMEITEPTAKVTLNWWFQDWAGGVGWMKDYVTVFEDNHPNIDLNLIPVPFNDLYAKLIPSISQGNEPEILYGYDEWLVGKDVSKLFYPLTPTIMSVAEFKDYIYEATLKNVTGSDGNFYGMPWATGANAFGFVYHKDLFREAGVDASKIKSWDDIKAAAKKLTKYNKDGSIARSGILFSYTEAANALLDMIQMQGARNKMFNPSTLEWNFKIPEAKKAMETFQWFVDNNIYDPESGDPFTSFPNKLGAMLLIGPWDVGLAMTQFPELEVGYILMPPFPTADTKLVLGSIVSYGALFVSKRVEGDTRNAALIFIRDIMTRPEELYDIPFYHKPPYWVGAVCNKKYIADLMSRPASEMNEFSQTCLTATNKGLPAVNVLETKISEPIIIRQVIHPEMESVFLGKKTIDQMLDYLTSYLTQQEKQLAE